MLSHKEACHSWEAQLAEEHHELDKQQNWEQLHEFIEQKRYKLEKLQGQLGSWEKMRDSQRQAKAVKAPVLSHREACRRWSPSRSRSTKS